MNDRDQPGLKPTATGARATWWRFLPIAIMAAVSAAAFASGAHKYLSFEYLLSSRQSLLATISAHPLPAVAIYMALYTAAVALSLPGATLLTIAGGFLFGVPEGPVAAVLAATLGAILIFLVARFSLADSLRSRLGPRLESLRRGFDKDAVSYMLFLRLTPAIPFFLVNLAPALLGVRLSTFAWTTLVGVIPATLAFSYAGAGLDSVAAAQTTAFEACLATGAGDCRAHIYLRELVTPTLLASLAGLGMVALIPVVVKQWRAHAKGVDRT